MSKGRQSAIEIEYDVIEEAEGILARRSDQIQPGRHKRRDSNWVLAVIFLAYMSIITGVFLIVVVVFSASPFFP